MKHTIVLNADNSYLNTVSWKKAIKMLVKGKAETLKAGDKIIHGLEMPLVLRLLYFVDAIYRNKVPYSRKNVYIRDGYTCQYCGSTKNLTLDHVQPQAKGGKTSFENCVTCCWSCNNSKGYKTLEEFGNPLKRKPHRPTVVEFLMWKMKNTGIEDFLVELKII